MKGRLHVFTVEHRLAMKWKEAQTNLGALCGRKEQRQHVLCPSDGTQENASSCSDGSALWPPDQG